MEGQTECLLNAIVHAKTSMAPLALEAYPEAYIDFKSSMLALMYVP